MNLVHLPPLHIVHDQRFRSRIDLKALSGLMESIETIGLQHPPQVRREKDQFVLVSGSHRVMACMRLEWPTIPCEVLDWDELTARRWEISENLHRSDLNVAERAAHVAEWIRLTGLKLVQPAPVSGGRGNKGGLREAVRELGVDRYEAMRAIKIDSLTEEAKEAAVTAGLDDNQSALLAAAQQPPEKQAETLLNYKPKRAKASAPASTPEVLDPANGEEAWRKSVIGIWNAAPPPWRLGVLDILASSVNREAA